MTTDNTLLQPDSNDDIDLLALLNVMLDYKWLIAGVTGLFAVLSIVYALLATPIYQATALVQIEQKKGGIAGLEGMAEMFGEQSQAVTEIEIIKSRMVIGKAVDQLQLDISAEPDYLPFIGRGIARLSGKPAPQIKVFQLEVPAHLHNEPLTLVAGDNGRYTLSHEGHTLLEGETGQPAEGNGIKLQIASLAASPGTRFTLSKRSRLGVILHYQGQLQAAEKGKQSGMIGLSLNHADPAFAKTVLNEFARQYVQQNVERMSAEAANSLAFLHEQLPQVRLEMEKAEQKLNAYQISAKSADITIETQAVLDQMVELETALSDLKLKQIEMDKKFTREHPLYQTLLNQISTIEANKKQLEGKVSTLPETQQELLKLARDVEVSSQIYTQMLQKAQELDIARASTVGNVRIIDVAEVNTAAPVAPKRSMIVLIATLLGGMLGSAIAFFHHLAHRGVENAAEIEALDLPVYSSIPYSQLQDDAEKAHKKTDELLPLLAREYPNDPSIEAIRSLHTSLHFALLEAPNNIIMFSGPSPQVGKSFVSVNLATLMAEAGKKVLLIDADMRKGYIHKFFGLSSTTHGLSTLLSRQEDTTTCITRTTINKLDLITRGSVPPNPSELLLSQHFNDTLQQLSQQYDIIIIDTPPILAVADALIVSKVAGASFLVVRFGENPLAEIRAALRRFETNGVKLKGAVLNATRKKALNYYNYQKYGYGSYQYNYTSDKD